MPKVYRNKTKLQVCPKSFIKLKKIIANNKKRANLSIDTLALFRRIFF